AQGTDVVQVGDAAGGDDRNRQAGRQFAGGVDVQPLHHAVAADVGMNNGHHAVGFELACQVADVVARQLRPAVGGDLAVARVQADDDVAGELDPDVGDEMRFGHRAGAENHVFDAQFEIGLDGRLVANAAADLHRDIAGGLDHAPDQR